MITYVKNTEIDTEKWDECIRRSVNSIPYVFSWYLDIVVDTWDALILNDYEAVFPLPYKQKYTFNYVFTPFWIQQLGLFSRTYRGLDRIDDFILAIPKHFKYVDLNLNHHISLNNASNYKLKKQNNFLLDLNEPYNKLEQRYSKNLLRNLKKSKSNELHLFKNDSPKVLIDLFKRDRGSKIFSFSEMDYKNIETIMQVSIYKHCGQIWMAYGEGNIPLAGIFLLFGYSRVVLLFTGNSSRGKEVGAMPFLIDEFIKESSNSSFLFDFEGSNDENLARFYKGFGGEKYPYQKITINQLPFPFKYFK